MGTPDDSERFRAAAPIEAPLRAMAGLTKEKELAPLYAAILVLFIGPLLRNPEGQLITGEYAWPISRRNHPGRPPFGSTPSALCMSAHRSFSCMAWLRMSASSRMASRTSSRRFITTRWSGLIGSTCTEGYRVECLDASPKVFRYA